MSDKSMDIQYVQVNHVKIPDISGLNMYIFHITIMDILNIHQSYMQYVHISKV